MKASIVAEIIGRRAVELRWRTDQCPECQGKGVVVLERGGWHRPPVLADCSCKAARANRRRVV